MFNPAVTFGVDLFINIFIVIVGFVTALIMINVKNTEEPKERS